MCQEWLVLSVGIVCELFQHCLHVDAWELRLALITLIQTRQTRQTVNQRMLITISHLCVVARAWTDMVAMLVTKCDSINWQVNIGRSASGWKTLNIDEKSISPVWTVPNVPLGPRYSAGFHSRQNPIYTELFTVISKGGNSGLINSADLDRIPVFTEQIGGRFGQFWLYFS